MCSYIVYRLVIVHHSVHTVMVVTVLTVTVLTISFHIPSQTHIGHCCSVECCLSIRDPLPPPPPPFPDSQGRDFFNALSEKDAERFTHQLFMYLVRAPFSFFNMRCYVYKCIYNPGNGVFFH